MLRSLSALLIAAALTLPLTAQTTPSRIGFVDIEIVLEQSQALRLALDEMDRELALRAREIDRQEREFRRQRFDLDRQERLLSEDERERRRDELLAMEREIEREQFEFESDLRSRERQIEPVLEYIMDVVADVAEREGYDMVLRGEVVIYGNRTADLTPQVITALDAQPDKLSEVMGLAGLPASQSPAGATAPSTAASTPAPPLLPQDRAASSASTSESEATSRRRPGSPPVTPAERPAIPGFGERTASTSTTNP
ncbi:MAG: OmpH family outer membrane protein [Sumerlaeia bacterium]